jgi:hypothetical protein
MIALGRKEKLTLEEMAAIAKEEPGPDDEASPQTRDETMEQAEVAQRTIETPSGLDGTAAGRRLTTIGRASSCPDGGRVRPVVGRLPALWSAPRAGAARQRARDRSAGQPVP